MPNMPFNPQMFGQFMQNPLQFMLQRKMNIPQNLANDPQAMIQHLMNTGQMNQNTYNSLNQFRKEFENKMQR